MLGTQGHTATEACQGDSSLIDALDSRLRQRILFLAEPDPISQGMLINTADEPGAGSGRRGVTFIHVDQAAPVDAYIAALPESKRRAMSELRAWIRAAAPEAEEVITYKMPGFKQGGKFLVSYDAYKSHYSLFPASTGVERALGTEIEPFVTGKGTISFTEDRPLTRGMVEKIIKARLEELVAGSEAGPGA